MQGGAVTLARLYAELPRPDLIFASDMFNLATFRALTATQDIPTALYFHENQLTYPQNNRQRHGWQYGFVNYISALAADAVYFNSRFHLNSFFDELPRMLRHFADYNELESIDVLRARSAVLALGLDLRRFDAHRVESAGRNDDAAPLIMWNHRWEDEKNPRGLFSALYRLQESGVPFRIALTGENFRQEPEEFNEARARLGDRVVQFGYLPDFAAYARLLWSADFVVSTAYQDFFGGSVAEGIYCGCVPLLADRLNYPDLVPEALHEHCLYRGRGLYGLLRRHLTDTPEIDRAALRDHVAVFDWSVMAPRYDSALEALARGESA